MKQKKSLLYAGIIWILVGVVYALNHDFDQSWETMEVVLIGMNLVVAIACFWEYFRENKTKSKG